VLGSTLSALELPSSEASDVDVELVESRVVVAGELDRELIFRDDRAANLAARTPLGSAAAVG
jgi:hypothetical protein